MNYLSPAPVRFIQSMFWAVAIWTALQFPLVQDSFVGDPDKAGLQQTLKLQRNIVGGDAAPVVYIDFGDADWLPAAAREPRLATVVAPEGAVADPSAPVVATPIPTQNVPLYVPRQALADILDFLSTSGAVAVFVDVDTSYAPNPQADRTYADAIDRWREKPDAPLLALARTNWVAPSIFDRNQLPEPAPDDRIVEGTVVLRSDSEQVVDNVSYWSCEGPEDMKEPRASVVLYLAAAARYDDGLRGKQAVADTLTRGRCSGAPRSVNLAAPGGSMTFLRQEGPIHYHMEVVRTDGKGPWFVPSSPSVAMREPVAARCGQTQAKVATLVNAADILAGLEAKDISAGFLCGAMVVVGASAELVRDVHPTPYGDMPGAFVLANAARGLDLSGPLRRFPYWIGLGMVVGISILVFLVHDFVHKWSNRVLSRKPRKLGAKAAHWLIDKATHPLTFSFLITSLLFLVGLALTFFMIRDGYWGVFAASATAASLSNAFDDVSGMRKVLLRQGEFGE